jgi:hypothetical protein
VKRRELIGIGTAVVGLTVAGCSQATSTAIPAAPPTSAPTRTEEMGMIIDPVIYNTLKDAVAATDVVLVGTMGPLQSFAQPYPSDPKQAGLPPDIRCDAVVTVKRVIVDRRPQPTSFSECRLSFFGGDSDGTRYVVGVDPLPTEGQDYFLLLVIADSVDLPHSSAPREGVPEMVTTMLGDGRWRVGDDGMLSPEVGFHPTTWSEDAFARKTLEQAAAAVRAAS